MSDLTKRLRERKSFDRARGMTIAPTEDELAAADRLDALEECLREFMAWADAPIGPHDHLAKVIDKARALLEGK